VKSGKRSHPPQSRQAGDDISRVDGTDVEGENSTRGEGSDTEGIHSPARPEKVKSARGEKKEKKTDEKEDRVWRPPRRVCGGPNRRPKIDKRRDEGP